MLSISSAKNNVVLCGKNGVNALRPTKASDAIIQPRLFGIPTWCTIIADVERREQETLTIKLQCQQARVLFLVN